MKQYTIEDKNIVIYTVSRLNREIRMLLEEAFPNVWVEGEVSNLARPVSGHIYFSLKDPSGVLNCVMFRRCAGKLPFELEDGMKVLCRGKVSIYDKRGQYQLYVETLEPRGMGGLQIAFEQLKRKLAAEGLFDEERKKSIPFLPGRVGIVTSSTGAAIRDILNVAGRRFPNTEILIRPVRVQGEQASAEIARAVKELNEYNSSLRKAGNLKREIALMIVGRGGGSLEDLWAFNEEEVARAIAGSEIPVISAVGHEVDLTISDLVADMRAPTPSAAAEMAFPVKNELQEKVSSLVRRISNNLRARLQTLEERLRSLSGCYVLKNPLNVFLQLEQRLDEIASELRRNMDDVRRKKEKEFVYSSARLEMLSPLSVLRRGYSITFKGNRVLKDLNNVKKDDRITVRLSEGLIKSRVENVEKSPAEISGDGYGEEKS
jgi:exodeoxyribonuclease VII large subunit